VIRLVALLARQTPVLFWLSTLTSVAGGLATTAVLIVVLGALRHNPSSTILLFAGLTVIAVGGRAASRLLVAAGTRQVVFTVRQRLAETIATTALIDLERLGSIRLRGAMTTDAGHLGTTLPTIVNVLSSTSFLIGCLAYLGWIQSSHLLGLLAVIVAGALLYRVMHRRIRAYSSSGRQVWDEIVGSCGLLVGGIKQIKADDRRRDDVLATLEVKGRRAMQVWTGHAWVSNLVVTATQAIFYTTLGGVVFASGGWAMSQEDALQFGLAIVYMAGPLREVVTALPDLAEAEVACARIESVNLSLQQARRERRLISALPDDTGWSRIDLQDIGMRYGSTDSAKFSLPPVSLCLRRGEVVFIVGGNGTGKTTLAKVLTGVYAPTEGEILVDGVAIDSTNRVWYAHQFAAIFSDFVLFERICLEETPEAQEWANALLERLGMGGRVTLQDLKLSRTTGFSSGERKRLALLTACLSNRPAMLFDEWAADQDPRFKNIFYREIIPELRDSGKAVVVISHDDRYFDAADRIVYLERGLSVVIEDRRQVVESAS